MITISLNMKFWDDGQDNSTRIRNVNFSWVELKKLSKFLESKSIKVKTNLYDFSFKKIISDSKHISYPIGTYKKSEKTNIILKDNLDCVFFMVVDCDAFFYEKDYEKFFNIIKNLNRGDIVTFDLAKLSENISDYIIDNNFVLDKADWTYAYSGERTKGPLFHRIGGLGGVYICDTQLLYELGGFDEKYVGWGGEDGDMLDRIVKSKKYHRIVPIRDFSPFHLPHFTDWGNKLYNKRFSDE